MRRLQSSYGIFCVCTEMKDVYTQNTWLIQLRAGLPARPSPHFVIFEGSAHGKVQKVSPEGIYKRKLPWATKCIIVYHFYC